MSESRTLTISDDDANIRLDVLLSRHLNIGRAIAQRLLTDGSVYINGSRVIKKGFLVSPGERIEIIGFADPSSQTIIPRPDLPLVELNHGPGWIAVDKPARVPVHPLRPGESETLLNAAVARYPQIQGIGEGGLRSGVVHRLDIDTSGVVLFALAQNTWQYLRGAFAGHRTRKIYCAIVAGKLTGSDHLVLDLCIARHSPARVKVIDENIIPKPAGTRRCDLSWRALAFSPSPGIPAKGSGEGNLELRTQNLELEKCPHPNPLPEYRARGQGTTLLEINLGTGFLHQIRVMLAHIGHPVLGDKIYGPPDSDIPRQMLHARSIRIGDIYADSPEPADFLQTVSLLGLDK